MVEGVGLPPKNGLISLWPSTNGAIPYFLVLPGSELSITEITEYTCFSPLKPCRNFINKSQSNTVPGNLIFEPNLFLWNIIFTFYYTRVRPQCDYSILGREPVQQLVLCEGSRSSGREVCAVENVRCSWCKNPTKTVLFSKRDQTCLVVTVCAVENVIHIFVHKIPAQLAGKQLPPLNF